ncbi:WD40-repeat-containing domain protein [Protomyces lactucae-debilis]|uniref:WD40-repeat-containing domain protein n=1 Tax=Protomyces lactucae-debilis TaxID=2754530 RepID=A0A1Y2F8U4_PROLT|nr:WD40-repeat-containing domain protein [Protomyces lactucae-debilis]ORY80047.1 WD40-repeat-containing domain protein [Protomyces lactucae-debilis]
MSTKTQLERNLEAAVFGEDDFEDRFEVSSDDNEGEGNAPADEGDEFGGLADADLFMVDNGLSQASEQEDSQAMDLDDESYPPAWHDSDDETLQISLSSIPKLRKLRRTEDEDVINGIVYERRLRAQFEKVYPVPDWALPPSRRKRVRSGDASDSASDDSGDEAEVTNSADPLKALLASSKPLTRLSKARTRQPGKLAIKRLRDANQQAPSHSAIQTMSFHPSFPLLLTGGYDQTLRIFHIDGKLNTPASSLYLRNVPIQNAVFQPDGKRVFAGSRRKHFHIWDLETGQVDKISRMYGHESLQKSMEQFSLSHDGKFMALAGSGGWVNLLSADTGQWLDAVKVTKGISDLRWLQDGTLMIANLAAEIWDYNLAERRVLRRWTDYGGLNTTKLATGGLDDRWIAVGSKSGIVNVYDRRKTGNEIAPVPTRSLDQITTSIHDLQISSDGQILAMASRAKKDALRMVHLPSCTVFSNWPTQSTPLGKIGGIAFSPQTEMLSVGNEAGKVTLWSLSNM